MVQKRSNECSEDFVNSKLIKLVEENDDDDDDVTLDSSVLSEDFKSCLEYDVLLKTFSATLEKAREDGNRYVCLGEEEIGTTIKFLPVIEKLVARYALKRSPKIIDIPFEACSGDIGDLITVVSVKENSYKRGHFGVDIRKCVKKEDGSYRYTSEGVRFATSLINDLKLKLLEYQSLISNVKDKSREVISMTMANVIINEINELADPRQNCQGCKTQHPSQKQHMGPTGCLATDQPTWEELCDQYWLAGRSLLRNDDIQTMAKTAATHITELQKAFLPGLISLDRINDDDVKDLVLRKDELYHAPLFQILKDM